MLSGTIIAGRSFTMSSDAPGGKSMLTVRVTRAWPRYTVTFEMAPGVAGTAADAADAAMAVSATANTSCVDFSFYGSFQKSCVGRAGFRDPSCPCGSGHITLTVTGCVNTLKYHYFYLLPAPEVMPLILQFDGLSGLKLAFPAHAAYGVEMVPPVRPIVPAPPERQAGRLHPSALVPAKLLDQTIVPGPVDIAEDD